MKVNQDCRLLGWRFLRFRGWRLAVRIVDGGGGFVVRLAVGWPVVVFFVVGFVGGGLVGLGGVLVVFAPCIGGDVVVGGWDWLGVVAGGVFGLVFVVFVGVGVVVGLIFVIFMVVGVFVGLVFVVFLVGLMGEFGAGVGVLVAAVVVFVGVLLWGDGGGVGEVLLLGGGGFHGRRMVARGLSGRLVGGRSLGCHRRGEFVAAVGRRTAKGRLGVDVHGAGGRVGGLGTAGAGW